MINTESGDGPEAFAADAARGSPMRALAALEARVLPHAGALPGDAGAGEERSRYIGFRLGEARVLARMQDISEILPYPDFARVPGTKPWLRGIGQVRGHLVSVVDLKLYLGGGATVPGRGTRMLVIERPELRVGLLVDEVHGMQQVPDSGPDASLDPSPDASLDPSPHPTLDGGPAPSPAGPGPSRGSEALRDRWSPLSEPSPAPDPLPEWLSRLVPDSRCLAEQRWGVLDLGRVLDDRAFMQVAA